MQRRSGVHFIQKASVLPTQGYHRGSCDPTCRVDVAWLSTLTPNPVSPRLLPHWTLHCLMPVLASFVR